MSGANDLFKEEYAYLCLYSKQGLKFTLKVCFPLSRIKKKVEDVDIGGKFGLILKKKVEKEVEVQEVRRERYDPLFMTQV